MAAKKKQREVPLTKFMDATWACDKLLQDAIEEIEERLTERLEGAKTRLKRAKLDGIADEVQKIITRISVIQDDISDVSEWVEEAVEERKSRVKAPAPRGRKKS